MQEPDDFVITPHGLVHKDCVHAVDEDDRSVYTVCPCKETDPRILRPRGPAGWIESATFTPPEPLKSLCMKFTVPEPPSKEGSLIYLFPGAQDARGATILQPVLQWGYNRKFGGSHWTIVSWHCTPEGHSRYSCHHPEVYPGETIHASIRVDGESPDSSDWIVEAKVEEEPEKHARLRVEGKVDDEECEEHAQLRAEATVKKECERRARLRVYNEKYLMLFLIGAALEAYSLPFGDPLRPVKENCGLFPGSETVFRDIKLKDLNCNPFRSDWVRRYPEVCGFGVDVSANKDRIKLTYC